MACATVTIQGSRYGGPIEVNALLANNSALTQISRKLATKLGLTEFSDVYVTGVIFDRGTCLNWKISKFPVIIKSSLVPNAVMYSYPVINGNESDAFYDMIIGQDVNRFQRAGTALMLQELQKSYINRSPRLKPTPGPGFEEDVVFMGHNTKFADLGLILRKGRNEFLEYPCLGSEAIDRIAVNYKRRHVAVRYKSAATVYRYKGISYDILGEIHKGSASKGHIVSNIRSACSEYTSSNVFPDCHILLEDDEDTVTPRINRLQYILQLREDV